MNHHIESLQNTFNFRGLGAAVLATVAFAGPAVATATGEGFESSATSGIYPDHITQHTSYSHHVLKYDGNITSEQSFVPNDCSPTVYMFAAKHKTALTNSKEQIVLTPLTQVCAEGVPGQEQPRVQSYDFAAQPVRVTKAMRQHIRSLQNRGYFVIARGQYGSDYQDTTVPLMQVSSSAVKTTSNRQKI